MSGILMVACMVLGVLMGRAQGPYSVAPEQGTHLKSLKGKVHVDDAPFSITLPEEFSFLDANTSREILVNYWGNDPEKVGNVVGFIIPDTISFVEDLNRGIILTYRPVGHVNDDRMRIFSFDKLLDAIRESSPGSEVYWAWEPDYNMNRHRLSTPLVYVENGRDTVYNGHQMIFGRDGVILTDPVVETGDLQWLFDHEEEMINGIVYNDGARYKDYAGKPDEAQYLSVTEFLFNHPNPKAVAEKDKKPSFFASIFRSPTWLAIFGALCGVWFLLWLGVLFTNSRDDSRTSIRRTGTNVILRMGIFVVIYLLSIMIGVFLVWVGVKYTIWMWSEVTVLTIIMGIGLWLLIATVAVFLIKPLFQFRAHKDPRRIEIQPKDAPELFALIEETAKETGVEMPKRVYVSPSVNACVFYDTMFWNIFFPVKKNLEVGLGLLYGLNRSELKAILAHEFGHFAQNSMKIGSVVSVGYEIIGNLVNRRDWLDELVDNWRNNDIHFSWQLTGGLTYLTISGLRKVMNKTYVFVQKGFLGLSRQMEYDADRVSADTVGNETAESAMCKIEIIDKRYEMYKEMLTGVITSKKCRPASYWTAYTMFISACEEFDGKKVEPTTRMTESDINFYDSRVQIKNPWLSHPTRSQRIARIRSTMRPETTLNNEPAIGLVPKHIFDLSSDTMFKFAEQIEVPVATASEFMDLLNTELSERSFPNRHRLFFNRKLCGFNPHEEVKVETEVEDPFTEDHNRLLREFLQGMSDYQVMKAFKNRELKEKAMRYDGVVYRRKNLPIEQQEKYLTELASKLRPIDIQVFHYALSKTDDKDLIVKAYHNVFYAQFIIDTLHDHIFTQRDELHKWVLRMSSQPSSSEYRLLQSRLLGFKQNVKEAIRKIEMQRLYPVMHVNMRAKLQQFLEEDYLFEASAISGDEIKEVFTIPDELVELFEALAYYSKKIVSDTIEGREPLMAWNDTCALVETTGK